MSTPDRPSPDPDPIASSLAHPGPLRPSIGELRVFLGAAPGVGKTYAMLREGRRLREDGHDVVIGFVETHGREETAAQVGDLEVIPRKHIAYKGVTVEEMDVDAILVRSPEIALVDEIAHTNAPGSARPKRWQDVEVLRRAGIDVITTVNIQHINELADVVWGITGVRVQETIPYSVLANATDVQLIDLPADDLVTRLERGKIYPPGRARQALEHFFQRGNLAALRELALRWTAAGLDEQLTGMMLQDERAAVEASDRVMVVLDEHAGWGDVLRVAWRLASTFRTDLDVLEIIPTGDGRSGPDNGRIAAHRQLAEDLGGSLVTVSDTGEESGRTRAIVEALRTNHTTILVLGVTRQKGRWGRAERIAGLDTVQHVLLQLPHIDVHVTVIEE